MGLLTGGPFDENKRLVEFFYSAFCKHWGEHCQPVFEIAYRNFDERSISRICHIGDAIFDGSVMPREPGPFKRASAFAVLTNLYLKVDIVGTDQDRTPVLGDELAARRAMLSYWLIPNVLAESWVEIDGKQVRLGKKWRAATVHLHLDLMDWVENTDAMIDPPGIFKRLKSGLGFGPPIAPIGATRIKQIIMALSMIIEQSYYISGNMDVMKCGVMNNSAACIDQIRGNKKLVRSFGFMGTSGARPP